MNSDETLPVAAIRLILGIIPEVLMLAPEKPVQQTSWRAGIQGNRPTPSLWMGQIWEGGVVRRPYGTTCGALNSGPISGGSYDDERRPSSLALETARMRL